MFSWLAKMVMGCWRPVRFYARMSKDDDFDDNDDATLRDAHFWSRDLEKHCYGDFSFAVVQANEVIEDHSQVETSRDATFVGVYDGHGGPEASRFICDHLFVNLMRLARERGTISEDILRSAFAATEEGFLTLVRRTFGITPLFATVGSCCLAGVIWRGTLYVANLGDSRAVIGCLGRFNRIIAKQLTTDHNVCVEEVRRELKSLHPDDSNIVVLKDGVWRVKGIIQVSRTIGDAHLKRPEFSLDPSFPKFYLPEPICRPVLSSEPALYSRALQPNDKFVIFASDGLWEILTNQEAAEIVYNNPRSGIARRLLKIALNVAARKRSMSYDGLKKLQKGERRKYHDDITVVVLFIDQEMREESISVQELSMRGFVDTIGPSSLSTLQGIKAESSPSSK